MLVIRDILKILFVLHLPNPSPNAAWTRIEFLAKYFKDKGDKVTIAGIFNLSAKDKVIKKELDGIKILNVIPVMMKFDIFSFIFNILSVIFTSWISFITVRPDVVIISVPPGESALYSFILAKLFRIKRIIFDYRDQWEDYYIKTRRSFLYKVFYKLLKSLMTKCYLRSDLIVTVTEPLAEDLFSRGIEDINIISNGADINLFKPQQKLKNIFKQKIGLRDDDFVLIYGGIIGGYYKLDIVIRALKIINHRLPNIKLILIGDGHDLKYILNLIDSLDVHELVLYKGQKFDKYNLIEMIWASDIGILSFDKTTLSLWKNTLSVKCLEYFACGLPVIATLDHKSVLGKLIEENDIGVLCEPENIEELSKAIERMYSDKLFVENASKRAVSLVHKQFDRNKLAEEYYKIIK